MCLPFHWRLNTILFYCSLFVLSPCHSLCLWLSFFLFLFTLSEHRKHSSHAHRAFYFIFLFLFGWSCLRPFHDDDVDYIPTIQCSFGTHCWWNDETECFGFIAVVVVVVDEVVCSCLHYLRTWMKPENEFTNSDTRTFAIAEYVVCKWQVKFPVEMQCDRNRFGFSFVSLLGHLARSPLCAHRNMTSWLWRMRKCSILIIINVLPRAHSL